MRSKWLSRKENFKCGDLVMIMNENMPRSQWKLGRVTEVNQGQDGLVRSCRIRTSDSVLVRPIVKLCLLEAAE